MSAESASVGPACPPEGAVNCDPEMTGATPTTFELRNKQKPRNFISGEIFRGGELEFWIENLPKDGTGCPGWWMFKQMMEHLGKNVAVVIGYWVSGDNLATVNALTAGGVMSLEDAAKQTTTGGYARSWGYTNVETVHSPQSTQGTQGTPGNYSRVYVRFKK